MHDRLRENPSTQEMLRRVSLNSDRDASLAVNVLVLRMSVEAVAHVSLIAHLDDVEVQADRATDDSAAEQWAPIRVNMQLIRRRLTILTNIPRPWWHALPFWRRLSYQSTEKVDERFWHPSLADKGRIELGINDEPRWVTFETVSADRTEIWMPAVKPV